MSVAMAEVEQTQNTIGQNVLMSRVCRVVRNTVPPTFKRTHFPLFPPVGLIPEPFPTPLCAATPPHSAAVAVAVAVAVVVVVVVKAATQEVEVVQGGQEALQRIDALCSSCLQTVQLSEDQSHVPPQGVLLAVVKSDVVCSSCLQTVQLSEDQSHASCLLWLNQMSLAPGETGPPDHAHSHLAVRKPSRYPAKKHVVSSSCPPARTSSTPHPVSSRVSL
ncbi:hypothetical protein CRUP_032570 [Coryphaenoides rupestris]|nr:hypothetical protein CRUP_032570 [Coryphaenoides rupestris]